MKTRRLGAACDFRDVGVESDWLIEWILEQQLRFDSLYYYRGDRLIHISYKLQYRRNIWAFSSNGVPTTKGIRNWVKGTT